MPLYLVTGGAGFIGSHVVDTLVARGDSVRVVDDFSTGKRGNLAHHDEIEVVEADLANAGVAESVVSDVDYVVHIAAIPSVPRSVKEPLTTHRANVDGTLRVLIAARDASVKRVVFASSSSVYGVPHDARGSDARRASDGAPAFGLQFPSRAPHSLPGHRVSATTLSAGAWVTICSSRRAQASSAWRRSSS